MDIQRWDRKLSQYLDMFDNDDVRVNKDYQRSRRVWPLNAKSYLVETVILGLVLPRLMLHEVRGRKGSKAHTAIVDGQQRTVALSEFRKGEFRLSGVVDRPSLKNKRYVTLEPADRRAFDRYLIRMDRFRGASDSDIRDVFRRINSYTVPLNSEEQRHAKFQGEFKWFVQGQLERFAEVLLEAAVLSEKQISRMADAKLLTEVVHAMLYGITTTNARALKKLYNDFDREFDLDRDFTRRLGTTIDLLASWGRLPKAIAKPHQAYSIILALLHAQEALDSLVPLIPRRRSLRNVATIVGNLTTLSAILELDEDDVPREYEAFYRASGTGTNVRAARALRFQWYFSALTSASI